MKRLYLGILLAIFAIGTAWADFIPPVGGSGGGGTPGGTSGQIQGNCSGSFCGLGVKIVSSGTSDTAASTDYFIAWNTSTTSAKTENIPTCSSSISAKSYIIKDEYGTNTITITPTSGTIENASSFNMYPLQSTTIFCDGSSNWMVN